MEPRIPLFFFPKDYLSAITLKLSFKQYSWMNVVHLDGVRIAPNQLVGYSNWEAGLKEYVLQTDSNLLLNLFSEGGQPADEFLDEGNVPALGRPRSLLSKIQYLFFHPKRRQALIRTTILASAAFVYALFANRLIQGEEDNFINMPAVAWTVVCGPVLFLFSVGLQFFRRRTPVVP